MTFLSSFEYQIEFVRLLEFRQTENIFDKISIQHVNILIKGLQGSVSINIRIRLFTAQHFSHISLL